MVCLDSAFIQDFSPSKACLPEQLLDSLLTWHHHQCARSFAVSKCNSLTSDAHWRVSREIGQSYQVLKVERPKELAIWNPRAQVASVMQHNVYMYRALSVDTCHICVTLKWKLSKKLPLNLITDRRSALLLMVTGFQCIIFALQQEKCIGQ